MPMTMSSRMPKYRTNFARVKTLSSAPQKIHMSSTGEGQQLQCLRWVGGCGSEESVTDHQTFSMSEAPDERASECRSSGLDS